MLRPFRRISRLEKKRRLAAAAGDKAILPPGVAIHWTDRQCASLGFKLIAGVHKQLVPGIRAIRGVVANESKALKLKGRGRPPPKGASSDNHTLLIEQYPVSVRLVPDQAARVKRREARMSRQGCEFRRGLDSQWSKHAAFVASCRLKVEGSPQVGAQSATCDLQPGLIPCKHCLRPRFAKQSPR